MVYCNVSRNNEHPYGYSQKGFTLVELLIALAILGLATSVVFLNAPPANQKVRREAQRFEARLSAASSQAITSGEIVGLEISSDQYSFVRYRGGEWTPLEGRVFSVWTLDSDITLNVDILETDSLRENNEIISGGGSIIRSVNDNQRANGPLDERRFGEKRIDKVKAPTIQFQPIGENTAFTVQFSDPSQSWSVSHSVAGEIKIVPTGTKL